MNEMIGRHRGPIMLAAALVSPLVLGAVLVPFRATFANAAAALTFIALISAIAVLGTRASGVVATVSAAIWFDFFLTVPYDRLTINHRPDLETTICLVIVGLFINELAARSRRHRRNLDETNEFVVMIHDLVDLAISAAAPDVIIDHATQSLTRLLSLRECHFETTVVEPPLARIESDGEVVHVGVRWPVDEIGLPGPQTEIVAQWRGRVVGRFVLTPTPGREVSIERRVVAVSLVDVVAANLRGQHDAV